MAPKANGASLGKIRNKYYVASPSVLTIAEQMQDNVPGKMNTGIGSAAEIKLHEPSKDESMRRNFGGRSDGLWTRKSLEDAVAHGESMLVADPTLEHVAIVKIVKLVRRPKPKFIVENV